MNITSKWDRSGQEIHVKSITITLEPGDDPDGHINGLISRGRLEAFLRAYGRPFDYGEPEDAEEARLQLLRFAFVVFVCASRLEGMQLAARDQWGMGWGTIADAVERPRATVKDQIIAARARYAEQGAWYDADGFHRASEVDAIIAIEGANGKDDGE